MLLSLDNMHQEPKIKKPPKHQAVDLRGDSPSELTFRASGVFSAQGTVASPSPVAGFSLGAKPLLMLNRTIAQTADEVKSNLSNGDVKLLV
jgi:hypothetical protein